MKLSVRASFLQKLSKTTDNKFVHDGLRFNSGDDLVDIQHEVLDQKDLLRLEEIASSFSKNDKRAEMLCRKIRSIKEIQANPDKKIMKRLEPLCEAFIQYIGKSPNKWLFWSNDRDDQSVPWYVCGIEYEPFNARSESPAHICIDLKAVVRGRIDSDSIRFYQGDLDGSTIIELLLEKGYYLETEKSVKKYWEEIERMNLVRPRTGDQFWASGVALSLGWRRNEWLSMIRDNRASKIVMDEMFDEEETNRGRGGEKGNSASKSFWGKRRGKDEDDEDNEETVILPVHPYVKSFDLRRHEFIQIHVNNLTEYEYDKSMAEKLVLSQDKKDLIHILIQGSTTTMEDIVKGKTGGIIVITTGPPGTGKTLSAEVFSENVERPLYVVQCSQLGTNEEQLEKHLDTVLDRATRWKAILLIDEADVYVHERGQDIQQNAIVGVFLRVLEYYRGILWMTSNRDTIIDDAIMSRCTAWIKYDIPDAVELARIWRVLSDQYKVPMSDELIHQLVDIGSGISKVSGRNVKNMLKLAKLLHDKTGREVDLSLFRHVRQFLHLA